MEDFARAMSAVVHKLREALTMRSRRVRFEERLGTGKRL